MQFVKTKLLLLVLPLITALAGCANRTETCQNAQAALATYLAIQQAGGEPSSTEIQIAAGATAFLTAYCGWTSPVPQDGVRGGPPAKDQNGVPIIVPPGFRSKAVLTGSIRNVPSERITTYGDWTDESQPTRHGIPEGFR